ncbi:MAG TPA: hypothetical protein VLZ30_12765 [Verrucomicrobiae bacterium]|nr:hypothetical protein [Verrucomicrobiae bacterium]
MNIKRYGFILVALLVLGWSLGAVHAAPTDNAIESRTEYLDPNADFSRLTESEALQLAYWVLYPGNHNYNGHRIAAMKEIREAAKLLAIELNGDGKGHEDQSVSDARFLAVQRLLGQLRSRLTGEDQKPMAAHVDEALKHLSKGLDIRAVENE